MDFKDNLRHIRNRLDISAEKLASSLGVNVATISRWETGKSYPSYEKLTDLSSMLGVSVDYLLGIKISNKPDPIYTREEIELINDYRVLDTFGKKVVKAVCSMEKSRILSHSPEPIKIQSANIPERYIPIFDLPAAAGSAAPLDNDGYKMILVTDDMPSEADYAVMISGKSMEPIISDGDTVYVKKTTELQNGDIGVFNVDGSIYCKHYYRNESGDVFLVSANPLLEATNIYIGYNSSKTAKCLGRVIFRSKPSLPDYFTKKTKTPPIHTHHE